MRESRKPPPFRRKALGNAIFPGLFRFVYMRQWNEHFGQVRTGLLLAAILIAVASLVVSHILTRDLEQEERSLYK